MKSVAIVATMLSLAVAALGSAATQARPIAATRPHVERPPSIEDLWREESSSRAKPILRLEASPGFVPALYALSVTPLLVVYPDGLALLQSRSGTGWGFRVTVYTPAVMRRISARLAALGVDHPTTGQRAFGSSGIADGPRVSIELTLHGRTQSVSLERFTGPLAARDGFGIDPRQAAHRHRLFALLGELQRPMAAFGTPLPRFRPADTVALFALASAGGPNVPTATWPRGISAPDPTRGDRCISVRPTGLALLQKAAPRWPALTIWRLPRGGSAYVIGRPSYPHERSCADAFA